MLNDIERSKTGVWVDTQNGQVVEVEPAEGVQLVPPGGELTAAVKASIERLRSTSAVVLGDVTDPAPEPVKAAAAKKAK